MAIQNLKCPNCGGELQLDDNLDKGFCMYCGGAIQIKEEVAKIKVEHSGRVEIDDSKKLANSIELADRAFDSGNYAECYNYCCTALECEVDNFHVIFRKGLCAAYLSISRTTELEQALKTAIELINKTSDDVYGEIYTVFSELLEYIKSTYTLNCNRSKGFAYPNLAAANNTFSIVAALTELCAQCSELISDEMMAAHSSFENDKKACLEQGLELCEIGVSFLKYFAGYQQVKRNGSYVNEEVYKKVKSPFLEVQKIHQEKFKNDFNNLPSTKKALMEYDGEIAKLQKDIDAFTNELEEYFGENPKISKEYKRKVWPFIVMASFSFLCSLVSVSEFANVSGVLDVIPLLFTMSIFLFLSIFALVKMRGIFKRRKEILNALPAYLLKLKNIHDQSKSKLQAVKQTKAAFVKKNVKK